MAIASPRASAKFYGGVRIDHNDEAEHRRELAEKINDLNQGKMNVAGSVTLTASVATTTLNDARIGPTSFIGLTPLTANASAEIGAGTIYISSQGAETATITHANNIQTDRTFRYAVIG